MSSKAIGVAAFVSLGTAGVLCVRVENRRAAAELPGGLRGGPEAKAGEEDATDEQRQRLLPVK